MTTKGCLKSGDLSENAIQKAVMQWVRLQPTIRNFIIHIPNEGKRTSSYGKYLKDMGMRAGVADLFIAMPRHECNGAWIELKSKNGILSPEQKEFLWNMESQNYFAMTCFSIEAAISTIEWYCF